MRSKFFGFKDEEERKLLIKVLDTIARKDLTFSYGYDDEFVYVYHEDRDVLIKRSMWIMGKVNPNLRFNVTADNQLKL